MKGLDKVDIALDLGTSNTRIYIDGKGKVLDEPSVISYDSISNEILAVGTDAYKMIGRTPASIVAVYPLEGGVITDSDLVEELVNVFLGEVCKSNVVMPRVVACIPCNITEVETRAVVNAISSFGVRRVYLIESAKAAALGVGIDIMSPHGYMIADIGSGTADIDVLSLGGVSSNKTIKVAGNQMDEEIIKYVRRKYNLIIGKVMAEQCKIAIGCVHDVKVEEVFRLKGRDALKGLPRWVDITSSEIKEAICDIAEQIVQGILDVLEQTPPELVGDIHTDGITLTGSLAKLKGMKELVSERTKLSVNVPDNPDEAIVRGCGKAIAYSSDLEGRTSNLNPLMTVY